MDRVDSVVITRSLVHELIYNILYIYSKKSCGINRALVTPLGHTAIMEHIRSFLLAALAVVVAAATAAAAGLPPLPSTMPADVPQPEIPPCLNDLMPCASVYDDSSMLGPCCDALGKVFKSDRACLCQIWEMARNDTRQVGSNALDGDQQMFARCKIPGASSTICDNGQAGAYLVANPAIYSICLRGGLALFGLMHFS